MRLIKILVIISIITLFFGCSSNKPKEEGDSDLARALTKYSLSEISQWRADKLPDVLLEFKYDDPVKWKNASGFLLNDLRTPSYIKKKLKADDALTVEGRAWLVNEGMIFKLLATFNSDSREDWNRAVSILTSMGNEPRDRCIIELIRRIQSVSKVKQIDSIKISEIAEGSMADISDQLQESFKSYNEKLNRALTRTNNLTKNENLHVQKAFWASQELANIGKPAIPYLMEFSRTFVYGFVNEMIMNAFSQMGEIVVPDLVKELEITDKILDTAELIFAHKKFLVKCIGNIYFNLNYSSEMTLTNSIEITKHVREDLKYNHLATKAITIELRDYNPLNDSKEFQFRIESIFALRKIGDKSACIPIVELWEKLIDDEDLEIQIRVALLDLSGVSLKSLKDWKNFVNKLTDPEDID